MTPSHLLLLFFLPLYLTTCPFPSSSFLLTNLTHLSTCATPNICPLITSTQPAMTINCTDSLVSSFTTCTSQRQNRVSGTCSSGQTMLGIERDGKVICGEVEVEVSQMERIEGVCLGNTIMVAIHPNGTVDCSSEKQEPIVGFCTNGISGVSENGTLICSEEKNQIISGTCPNLQVLVGFAADGSVLCSEDKQVAFSGSCSAGRVVIGIGEDGSAICSNPIEDIFVQTCSSDTGINEIVNGVIGCSDQLQRDVQGTCSSDRAITSVSNDGSVICSDVLQNQVSQTCSSSSGIVGIDLNGNGLCSNLHSPLVSGTCQSGILDINDEGVSTCAEPLIPRVTDTCSQRQGFEVLNRESAACSAVYTPRISNSCPANQGIRHINVDGDVTCSTDIQPRVTGTCSSNEGIRSVSGASVGCTTINSQGTYTAANFLFDSPQSYAKYVSALSFTVNEDSSNGLLRSDAMIGEEGILYHRSSTYQAQASFYLPVGSQITSLRMYVRDESSFDSASFRLDLLSRSQALDEDGISLSSILLDTSASTDAYQSMSGGLAPHLTTLQEYFFNLRSTRTTNTAPQRLIGFIGVDIFYSMEEVLL